MALNYDDLAKEYARHRRVHPEVLKELVAQAGLVKESQVLEVGCGTGNYIHTLVAETGCGGKGVDPSEGMLIEARKRSGQVEFRQGKGEAIDFQVDSFDLVFSVDVIHHIFDRQRYYSEAFRVLKAGGQVCTVTDSEWIIYHRRPLSLYFPETVGVELNRYPKIDDLEAMIALAGFQEIKSNRVEFSYVLTDIQAYREKAFSSLHLIPDEAFQRGIEKMEQDAARGGIECNSYYQLVWGKK